MFRIKHTIHISNTRYIPIRYIYTSQRFKTLEEELSNIENEYRKELLMQMEVANEAGNQQLIENLMLFLLSKMHHQNMY